MIGSPFWRQSFSTLLLATLAAGVLAQDKPAQKPFEPQVGQEGKDVIWVPTPKALVEKMLDMAKVTSNDYVIDLGSGDGVTVIAAAKRGAKAHGIEYNPDMVELSKRNAAKEGVTNRATFAKADIFESDFSQATVITMYLLPQLNLKLRPKILDLKPGTRIVSHAFTMDDWKPDQTESVENRTAYMWIVPAKVEGTWKLPQGELTLQQNFQTLSGSLKTGDRVAPIEDGRVRGGDVIFKAGGVEYSARANGESMEGTMKGSSSGSFTASRTAKPTPAPPPRG